MDEAVVLYPSPTIGHLISLVELGKHLLTHQPSLSIHILMPTEPYSAGKMDTYVSSFSGTFPSIKFHHLPTFTLSNTSATHHETFIFEALRLSKPHVHEQLLSISKNYTICGIIIDFLATSALSLATEELNIPAYIYITSCASFLASYLYLPTLHQKTTKSFRDVKEFHDIPGLPPIHGTDMVKPFLDREDDAYINFLDFAIQTPQAKGIIINTFELLESKVIKTISDGLCVPNNRTPPLFCVGPLILAEGQGAGGGSKSSSDDAVPDECITWLDSQPSQSVVFLCFGSLGLLTKEQLREIAIGLEKSGQRFLWVVRNPPANDLSVAIKAQGDPDLDSLLPDGFLERTKERGLVVKLWAPQVKILNHSSIGGFVTHCGWNSTLEAVCAGVPMVAWPLYAEQRLNRVVLVEEMKLALSMNESEDGFVRADEVEKKVRGLMESEEGELIRERAIAMKNAAKAAMDEGGSSYTAFSKLIESWKHGK
ncbi:UDP-glycosyltransferase 88A1 [Populus alba]|uniref:Glycosyltransferase n=1 Tax=Populus alba x Populus x berolinensis TaxID=444605 RepID=A0AAD6LHI6_9ROSI|nr:UDP-glycosyltransferase 88A1-like [Populus alba]KAJ6960841.1 UDP-glycosyltransferase 88A1-like [Populus alba x Populus x berolinensis]